MLAHSEPVAWVLAMRCEELTSFFKIIPFFVSETFFIAFIAIGFWLGHHKKFFLDLILVVCLTTILNNALKGAFAIPRPDNIYHLIPVIDPWGFPSGDVHQAGAFWGVLWLYFRTKVWGILAFLMIPLVLLSRLYLGVHSGYDVLGGLGFGLITVIFYHNLTRLDYLSCAFIQNPRSFWVMLSMILIMYGTLSSSDYIPIMVPLSLGALIGYGVSLPSLRVDPAPYLMEVSFRKYGIIIGSFILIFLFFKVFPSSSSFLPSLKYPILIFKMALTIWLILIFIPWLQEKIYRSAQK